MNRFNLMLMVLLAGLTLGLAPVHAKKAGDGGSELPAGLQKKADNGGALPSGWQKRLKKGEVLEPEVVKQGRPVSEKVRAALPVGAKGSIDLTLDGKVIRLDEKTRKVLDVFEVKL